MSDDGAVGAVILAAGTSRRYGSPKQMAVLAGRTLLEHVVAAARGASLTPIVAVVPVWLARWGTLAGDDVLWVRNPFPERGMSLSLRLGLGALDASVSAAMILLGDQPGVSQAVIAAVLAARGKRPLIAAEARGVLAPPVLLERSQFQLVEQLGGDVGLRGWLRSHRDLVEAVPVGEHPPDVDTPEELSRLAGP